MDNNYNNYGGGGGGSSFSNNQQRPNMNNNNYNNNGGGGGGFAQGQRAPNSGGNFYGNSMPQANPTISVYVSQNTQVGVPAFGNSNTAQDNRRYENDNDHWKTAFEKQQQFSQDLLQRIPYYTNPQHQQHNMGNNASVGRQRANVGNNSYEHVPQRNNGYDSVPQRTNVGGAGYGNPANEFVDPLYNNNVQQPSCSYGNANGYEFTKQADFSYDNVKFYILAILEGCIYLQYILI
ncbi:unnamed protein product [Meloidogyne enterolobii]|uniref:Uncharacterized protein n=1 Tax=Meloidogyne enterolobii TaxID=390850 RepID=A0ACB1B2W7_MELEN